LKAVTGSQPRLKVKAILTYLPYVAQMRCGYALFQASVREMKAINSGSGSLPGLAVRGANLRLTIVMPTRSLLPSRILGWQIKAEEHHHPAARQLRLPNLILDQ